MILEQAGFEFEAVTATSTPVSAITPNRYSRQCKHHLAAFFQVSFSNAGDDQGMTMPITQERQQSDVRLLRLLWRLRGVGCVPRLPAL